MSESSPPCLQGRPHAFFLALTADTEGNVPGHLYSGCLLTQQALTHCLQCASLPDTLEHETQCASPPDTLERETQCASLPDTLERET